MSGTEGPESKEVQEFVGPVLLAHNFVKNDGRPQVPSVDGWLASEKLDGYRALWTGKRFVSRTGKEYSVPDWLIERMPPLPLDGEFWLGRGNFEQCGMFRRSSWKKVEEEWLDAQYHVFDAPTLQLPFHERLAAAAAKIKGLDFGEVAKYYNVETLEPVHILPHKPVKNLQELQLLMKTLVDQGAEGVMVRDPQSAYEGKRSRTLLKLKPAHDTEAVIVGYEKGKGKYKGMLGAFLCRPLSAVEEEDNSLDFKMSGMTDEVRSTYRESHPIGTVVTYTYTEMTGKGKPRFPRYLRIYKPT